MRKFLNANPIFLEIFYEYKKSQNVLITACMYICNFTLDRYTYYGENVPKSRVIIPELPP